MPVTPVPQDREGNRKKVAEGLKLLAEGIGIRAAARNADCPYGSLQFAAQKLGFHEKTDMWKAYVQSVLPDDADADPEINDEESPLGPRLERRANRYGDAVPYGNKGPWGKYREGVKEMTQGVHDGKYSAAEAVSLLAMEGVRVSERVLMQKAKQAPGKSPVKMGAQKRKLGESTEESIAEEVRFYRKHDITVTRPTLQAIATSMLKDEEAAKFKNGVVSNRWLYSFYDREDMNTGSSKSIESDRDLWTTSANAEAQYAVWAGLAVRNKMADINPAFDPAKEYDELIIWRPDGLKRLVSMDETDVRSDQTKRGHATSSRSVRCQAPASRAGHGQKASGKRKADATPAKAGWAGKKRKVMHSTVHEGEIDKGDCLATKNASKHSWAGGTLGNGDCLSPLIMASGPITAEELASAPEGTARDANGNIVPATFNVNSKRTGGMISEDMLIWVHKIAIPSTGVTPTNRGMSCMDGLGSHHSFEVVKGMIDSGLDPALRFPHGSQKNQHEDFEPARGLRTLLRLQERARVGEDSVPS